MSTRAVPDPSLTRAPLWRTDRARIARGPSRGSAGLEPWWGGCPAVQRGHQPSGGALFLCVGLGKGPRPEGERGQAFNNQAPTHTPLLKQVAAVRLSSHRGSWANSGKTPRNSSILALGQGHILRNPLSLTLWEYKTTNKQINTTVVLNALTAVRVSGCRKH